MTQVSRSAQERTRAMMTGKISRNTTCMTDCTGILSSSAMMRTRGHNAGLLRQQQSSAYLTRWSRSYAIWRLPNGTRTWHRPGLTSVQRDWPCCCDTALRPLACTVVDTGVALYAALQYVSLHRCSFASPPLNQHSHTSVASMGATRSGLRNRAQPWPASLQLRTLHS